MADYSNLISALNDKGVNVNVRNSKIHTPSDQDGKQEDLKVEYDLMDLICGIAGAALFGKANMNDATKLSSLISGDMSQKSLYSHVKQIRNILEGTERKPLYVTLSDKMVGSSVQNISFSGSNNSIAGLSSLIDSLKGEGINTGIVKYLKKSLDRGGDLYNIFENLDKIGNNDKYEEIQEYIYNLSSIIDSLVKLTNIGLIARLRIRINLNFIKNYINNDLLEIIQDIDNNFKNLNSHKIQGLNNVSELFNIVSSLGQLNIADRIKMYTNLKFIKHFLFKDILSIFEGINNTFDNDITETSVETINNLFGSIIGNVSIKEELIDNAENSINSIGNLLAGNDKKFDETNLEGIIGIANIINKLNPIFESSTLSLDNIKSYFDELQTIINGIIQDNVTTSIKLLYDEVDTLSNALSGFSTIDSKAFNKTISEIIKTLTRLSKKLDKENYFDSLLIKLSITKDTADDLNNTIKILNGISAISFDSDKLIKFFEDLEKIETVLSKFAANGKITSLGIESLNSLSEKLTVLIESFNKIKPETIKQITNLIQEVEKFLLISAGLLIIVGLIGHNLSFEDILKYIGVTTLLLTVIGGFIILLNVIPLKAIDRAYNVLDNISSLIKQTAITFGIISLVSKLTKPQDIIGFELLFSALLFVVGEITLNLKQFKYAKDEKTVSDFSSLILSLSAALALGALVSKFIHIEELLTFGKLLALLIAVVSVPLLLLSVSGGTMIEGADNLGKLILECTVGLLIGALFIKIPGMKDAVDEFKWTYLVFVSGILLAVGIASRIAGKNGLEGIEGLSKVILYATGAMLIGAALFYIDGFKTNTIQFALTLGLFIGLVSISVGLAIKLMGENPLKTIIALNVLIVTIAGMMTFAAYVIKDIDKSLLWNFIGQVFTLILGMTGIVLLLSKIDNKKLIAGTITLSIIGLIIMGLGLVFSILYKTLSDSQVNQNVIWNFVFQSLVLVGGIGVIMLLLGKMSIASILKGILAISLIGLVIAGLCYVFGYIYDKLLKYDNVVGKMWGVTMSMLGIVAVYLIATAAIGALLFGPQALFVGLGILAIGLTALIVWGMAYAFGVVMEVEREYNISSNNNKVKTAIDGMFSVIEYALGKVINMNTRMNIFGDVDTNTFSGKLAAGFESLLGMFFAIPKLIIVGLTVFTLWATANAIKGINEVLPDESVMTALNGKVDLLFQVIEHAVQKIINLNTRKKIFGNVDTNTFGGKLAAGFESVVGGLFAVPNLMIIGLSVFTLWGTVTALKNITEILPDKTALNSLITKVDLLFQVIEHAVQKIINLNTKNKSNSLFGKALNFVGLGKLKSGADALANAGIVGVAILSLKGMVDGIKELNEKLPDAKTMLNIRLKISFLCQSIIEIVKTIANINNSSNIPLLDKLPIIGPVLNRILPKKEDAISTALYTLNNVANNFVELSNKLLDKTQLANLKTKIIDSLTVFNDKEIKDAFETDISKRKISNIKYLFGTTSKMLLDICKVYNKLPKNINELNQNISSLIGTYLGLIETIITNITPQSDNIKNIFDEDGVLDLTYNFLKKSVKLIDEYDDQDKYNIFADGIAKIYIETIGKITKNDEFYKHTETLKTYVETINSIDISKVDKLTNLTDSLNEFGNRFEDMGSFVRAISVDLTTVLNHLADKMTEAKETIKNADKLNEKRKNSINESVTRITELMKQKLIVNIENTSNNSTGETPTPDSSTVTTTGTTPATTTITPKENIPAGDVTGDKGKSTPVQPFRGLGINNSTIETLLNGVIAGNAIRVKIINN